MIYQVVFCFVNKGWGWGDPHFVTLDGANYTFNGLGEYVMIDAQNGTFQLQAGQALPKEIPRLQQFLLLWRLKRAILPLLKSE